MLYQDLINESYNDDKDGKTFYILRNNVFVKNMKHLKMRVGVTSKQ